MSDELPPDRPRLRPHLAATPDERDPRFVVLYDPQRLATPLRLPRAQITWANQFTGRRTLDELHALFAGTVPREQIAQLAAQLDEHYFLDSPRLLQRLRGPVRAPSCVGCYPAEPAAIQALLDGLFTAPGGPGLPGPQRPDANLRAVLAPHMDFARGHVTYAWAFKELAERSPANVYVIVATSHYSPRRFTLTRQHFRTPLGVVTTDQAYLDRIVNHYGDGLFDEPDNAAHLIEHSIELEVVFLQHVLRDRPPFRIVPLLVGSFYDCIEEGEEPGERVAIARMVEALRRAEAEAGEPVVYVISGDLAHVGPKFDDPEPVGEPFLTHSQQQDERIIAAAETADPAAYFRVIADEQDRRRICGLSPTYLTLAAARPRCGRLTHYGRYVHPQGYESVSFAGMVFDR